MIRLRLRAFWRYRPRVLTLAMLLVIAAPIALANFTSEFHMVAVEPIESGEIYAKGTYGWPFTWHWHNLTATIVGPGVVGWECSGTRLAANLACWTIMLAVPAGACEWLLRRYRPRLRWSLRTMLGAVAILAVFCAWFAEAWNRANLQDPIIAELVRDRQCVAVERPGPKWLEFVVPDSFRRRIVAVDTRSNVDGTVDEAFVVQLGRLPRLTYLNLEVEQLTPPMAAALRNLPQLRWLHIQEEQPSRQSLAAIGELTQLEGLRLYARELTSDSLLCLGGLTKLRMLTIDTSRTEGAFSQMPPFPQLESLDIKFSPLSRQDLRRLAVLPRLKALDLKYAEIDADASLAELSTLSSLEELTIDGHILSAAGLESLAAVKRLRSLHIAKGNTFGFEDSNVTGTLKLGEADGAPVSERELNVFRKAFDSLRQSHPGIVIDGNVHAIRQRFGREPPWDHIRYGGDYPASPWNIESSTLRSTWLPARYRWPQAASKASGSGFF